MKITEILDQYKVKYTTNGQSIRSGWVGMDCPWCCVKRGERYLGINLNSIRANCWRCGPKSVADILVAIAKIPLGEAIAVTGDLRPAKREARATGTLKPPRGIGPLLPQHRAYLEHERGLNPDQLVTMWELGGIGLSAGLKWCVYIPVVKHGEVVSWTTRSIGKGGKRYHSAAPEEEIESAKSILYGMDYARHGIIIVEGPVDAWTIGPGAVATLGLGTTPAQIAAAADYPMRAICFDVEPEAQRRARKLADELSIYPGQTHVIELETGKDANSADWAEILEIRDRFLAA